MTRAYLLVRRRLELNFLRLVPDRDHIRQRLQALRDQVLLGGLKHKLLDEVNHLVDESYAHGQISHDHHLLQTLSRLDGDIIV